MKSKLKFILLGVGGGLGLILLAFLLMVISSGNRSGENNGGDKSIGDTGTIIPGHYKSAIIAVDEASFDAVMKAEIANDDEGKVELARMGKLFLVDPGTKCRVLDFHVVMATMSYKVRILDGKQSGRAGYIAAEFVH